MPGSADKRGELLARALDDGVTDSADERLRRELAMVGLLARSGELARPDAAARDRMRERIAAALAAEEFAPGPGPRSEPVTRLAAVAAGSSAPPAPRVSSLDQARRRRSAVAGVQGRLLVAAAASLCLLLSLSAMSLVLARDALPGDALYRVKRSAESAELGLTFGDEPRGFKHLQFATARVDEIEALAVRAGDGGDIGSFVTALRAFDIDAAAGSRLVIESATNGGGDELAVLRDWAEQQEVRLGAARSAMPDRAASRTNGSIDLLGRVADRSSMLQARLGCLAVTTGARDEIGLMPATGVCEPAPGAGPLPSNVSPTGSRTRPVEPPALTFPNTPADQQPTGSIGPFDPLDPLPDPAPTGPPGAGEPPTGPDEPPPTSPPPGQTITIPLPLPVEITVPPLLGLLPGLKLG